MLDAHFRERVAHGVDRVPHLVRPDRAYFGEKDYQQLQIIRDLAREFFLPTDIVGCPTIREESGLAASSRNTLLSAEGRQHFSLNQILAEANAPQEQQHVL